MCGTSRWRGGGSASDRPGDSRVFRRRPGQCRQRGGAAGGAHDATQISQKDMEEAVEKVVAGPERKSRRLGEPRKSAGSRSMKWATRWWRCLQPNMPIPFTRSASSHAAGRPSVIPLQLPAEDQLPAQSAGAAGSHPGHARRPGGGRGGVWRSQHRRGKRPGTGDRAGPADGCMFGMSESVGLIHCAQRQNPFDHSRPTRPSARLQRADRP